DSLKEDIQLALQGSKWWGKSRLMIILVQRFFSGLSPYCLNTKTHGNPTAAAADPWLIKK
ncbi:TPA: hypothetical protein OO067_003103, partial [Legionella pneumophila]|nr:hypothetical protein [Legionella pneumophila]